MFFTFVVSPLVVADDEDWNVTLVGVMNKTVTKADFETLSASSNASFTDKTGDVFSGVPLINLIGLVDDEETNPDFSSEAAKSGYNVIISGEDGYSAQIPSENLSQQAEMIVCNLQNGEPFASWDVPPYPLNLYGTDITPGQSVGNIAVIELKGISASDSKENASEGNITSGEDMIYSGSVELTDATIEVIAGSGKSYDLKEKTPLGALAKAAKDGKYAFDVADHSFEDREILLLDSINDHRWEKETSDLVVAVNGKVIEDWGTDSGNFYNELPLKSGDVVTYLFGMPPVTLENGTKIIELTVV